MNSFYASVEILDRPDLKNVPMAVSGDPQNRHGIILAKNQLAKAYGVKTAETISRAMTKCPQLQCVSPHMEKYSQYSREINRIYSRYTDLIEVFSIDESWLDVTASSKLFGDGKTIADEIRHVVKDELGLTLSAGVSYNKIFAKMGSEYKKPDATTLITRDNYKDLLWPLPVEEMFFVGTYSAEKLKDCGLSTIGLMAQSTEVFLSTLLGKQGKMLYRYVNGLDNSPVQRFDVEEEIKSLGNGMTFCRNLLGTKDVSTALTGLCDKVTWRLRNLHKKAGGIKVEIKDPQFNTTSRQVQMTEPSDLSDEFYHCAMGLIEKAGFINKPIRLISITAIYVCDADTPVQLSFFHKNNASREKSQHIHKAMDIIRSLYGSNAITFGSSINNDIGMDTSSSPHDTSFSKKGRS